LPQTQAELKAAFDQSLIDNYGHEFANQHINQPTESENNLKQLDAGSENGKEEAEIAALPPDQQKFVRDNQGIGGSLRVGAESFGNQALFGLPEMAYDKFADPKDVAQHEALKNFHQTANVVGGGLGAGLSLAIGGPLFDAAGAAGKLVEGAVIGGREAEQVSLARTIASKIVGGAAEGVVTNSPRIVGNAALGDPKEAGENLLMSAGIGGLLGPATFGLGKAISGVSNVGSEVAGQVSSKVNGLFEKTDPLLSHFGLDNSNMEGAQLTESGAKEVKGLLKGVVRKNLELGGLGFGGPLGFVKGKIAGALAGEAVDRIPEQYLTTGLQATLKASNFAETQLAKIPDILENLSTSNFGKAANASANIFSSAGKDIASAKDDYESFEKLSTKLAQNQATSKDQDIIGHNSSLLSHNADIQTAYQTSALNAVNYLNTVIPKNPNPPQMFSPQNTWKPTVEQLKDFKSQLAIVNNPYSVLDKLANGTITDKDVAAVKTLYPTIYSKIQGEILKHATDPKYANLSFAAKNKISLLTGTQVNPGLKPANITALQSNFQKDAANNQQAAQGGSPKGSRGSKKALSNNPSLSTETQLISQGQPGSAT
jgi:hypothetical protein